MYFNHKTSDFYNLSTDRKYFLVERNQIFSAFVKYPREKKDMKGKGPDRPKIRGHPMIRLTSQKPLKTPGSEAEKGSWSDGTSIYYPDYIDQGSDIIKQEAQSRIQTRRAGEDVYEIHGWKYFHHTHTLHRSSNYDINRSCDLI